MNLFCRITTDTGKVIGKGANKSIKIEVLDSKQNVIFEKMITHEQDNQCRHDWHEAWNGTEQIKICYKCDASMDSDGGIIE